MTEATSRALGMYSGVKLEQRIADARHELADVRARRRTWAFTLRGSIANLERLQSRAPLAVRDEVIAELGLLRLLQELLLQETRGDDE
jgi:hypothetical protein